MSKSGEIDFKQVGKKWKKYWEDQDIFKAKNDFDKPKKYILDMFPYPSGKGLHIGHTKGYTATDILTRTAKLKGNNVLHPIGWDAFGLPAENYALKTGTHPEKSTNQNISNFKKQLKGMAFSYDWDREINTTSPEYYKWTQWIFLKLYKHYYDESKDKAMPVSKLREKLEKKGKNEKEIQNIIDSKRLAFPDHRPIIWCPECKTGLAKEDLEDGNCERCGSQIEKKPMQQWVLRITDYADRMLDGLKDLDWEDSIKKMQKNWIGRSEGVQFEMEVADSNYKLSTYTTRIDTVYGMSFVAIAPEHPLLKDITKDKQSKKVQNYVKKSKSKTELQRTDLNKDKTGVFTGSYVINPFNGKKIPVYVADYVLMNYGTGVVMAVPAHDERDWEFAKKYDLEIIQSVLPEKNAEPGLEKAYTEYGYLYNSDKFSGLSSKQAQKEMTKCLEKEGIGRKKVNYKLQDWVFARQRYWGEPIPMVHCKECGVVPMDESNLPLELPEVDSYEPTGSTEGPLANIDEWVNVKCPKCGGDAKRETNTMPQWAGSSWYWLRYMDPENNNKLVSSENGNYWGPVDTYVGGAEHATRHLIYGRFWHKFLYDIGVVGTKEPFKKLQHVGLVLAKDGKKISKRLGNGIDPLDMIEEWGADIFKTYMMFMGPFDQAVAFKPQGLKGVRSFFKKVLDLFEKTKSNIQDDKNIEIKLNQTIKKANEDIQNFKFNTTIASMMELVNEWTEYDKINKDNFEKFIIILSPFAGALCEELWSRLGNENSIYENAQWPKYDKDKLTKDTIEMAVQVNGNVRGTINIDKKANQKQAMQTARQVENINKYISDKDIRKIIYKPGKILNIVV